MTVPATAAFRLAFVPGVTPAKWVRAWARRRDDAIDLVPCDNTGQALRHLSDGEVHAALVREPPADPALNAIPLYEETTVAIVAKDHVITAASEITAADLTDEALLVPVDDPLAWTDRPGTPIEHRPPTVRDAVELAATGIGVFLAPQSLARLHHRRDVAYRPVADAPLTPVALVWRETTADVEEFIGVVRGRRPNSSRGQAQPPPKRTAREKMLAKRAAREAAGKHPPAARKPRRPRRG